MLRTETWSLLIPYLRDVLEELALGRGVRDTGHLVVPLMNTFNAICHLAAVAMIYSGSLRH